jgi:hypothetical protein
MFRWPALCLTVRALVVVLAAGNPSTGAPLRTPYTEFELESAVSMGIPNVRTWADAPLSALRQQVPHLPALNGVNEFFVPALSGGGEHGAFGAELLQLFFAAPWLKWSKIRGRINHKKQYVNG